MNVLSILLQAAPAGAAGQQGGGPQRKQQKEMEQFRNSLKKGDKVVTAGGIYGTIAEVKENERYVVLRIDSDTKIRVDKSSIQKDPTAPAAAPEPKEPKEPKEIKEEK